MQGDGNLVEYGHSVVWETATNFNGADAVMQGDGNFVVHSSAGSAAWNCWDRGQPRRLPQPVQRRSARGAVAFGAIAVGGVASTGSAPESRLRVHRKAFCRAGRLLGCCHRARGVKSAHTWIGNRDDMYADIALEGGISALPIFLEAAESTTVEPEESFASLQRAGPMAANAAVSAFALGHVIHTKPLSHTHTALAAGSPDAWRRPTWSMLSVAPMY